MVQVKIGSVLIPALLDSGHAQTMICEGVIESQESKPNTNINMVCIHGEAYTYPRRRLVLTVMNRLEKMPVAFTQTLLYPMLLGRE